MDCQRFENLISDYLEGQLSEAERRDFDAHCAGCPDCPDLLLQVRQVIAICHAFPESKPPDTLAERILTATVGERRRFSWSGAFDWASVRRFLQPQFAVGLALVVCSIGLFLRMTTPETASDVGAPQAILTKVDAFTHKIYSQGIKLYNAKNEAVAEYQYLKTTLFNQIEYHLSQITGQMKEEAPKPAPPADSKPNSKQDRKSALFLFCA